MTLRDTKPGEQVISNSWTGFVWKTENVPRELTVIEHVGDCVWCRSTDGFNAERYPLHADLVCRRVV